MLSMHHIAWSAAVAMVVAVAPTVFAQGSRTSSAEEAAVRIPLEAYLKGHATGDSAAFRRAFKRLRNVGPGTVRRKA